MRIKDAVWKVKNLIVVQVLFYLLAGWISERFVGWN